MGEAFAKTIQRYYLFLSPIASVTALYLMGPQLTTTISWYVIAIASAFSIIWMIYLFAVPYTRQKWISSCEQAYARVEADPQKKSRDHLFPFVAALFICLIISFIVTDSDTDPYFQNRRGHFVLEFIIISRSHLIGTYIKIAIYSLLLTLFELGGIGSVLQLLCLARKAHRSKVQ